jgi:hypothetical protein
MDLEKRTQELKPWEMEKYLVEVLENFDAKVVYEENQDYYIEFHDGEGTLIEAKMSKKEFEILPYPVTHGTDFWIVVYKLENESEPKLSIWPIAKYWHKSWQ